MKMKYAVAIPFFVGLLAFFSTSYAAVTVGIVKPQPNQFVGETVSITVTASSVYEVASIVAAIEGRQSQLTFSNNAICGKVGCYFPGWIGTINLAGLAEGIKTLTVTATDQLGNTGSASLSVRYDLIPVVTVAEPVTISVATPKLRVAASCTDTSTPCTSLKVVASNYTVLAEGTESVDQEVSLLDYNGKRTWINFIGTDIKGQTSTVSRAVWVDASERLKQLASIPGEVWDYREDERILYLDYSSGTGTLKILNPDDATTEVVSQSDKVPIEGYLTPHGAIFNAHQSGNTSIKDWFEYRDGAITTLPRASSVFKIVGNYAIWGNNSYDINVRDLVAGTDTLVATYSETQHPTYGDLSANGDVVFMNGTSIYDTNILRYRGGSTTRITNDIGAGSGVPEWSRNFFPKTDGINIAYVKQKYRNPGGEGESELCLNTGTEEVRLTAPSSDSIYTYHYKLNNGWIAYTKPGITNQRQIWLRGPGGTTMQATFFSAPSTMVALSPDGELLYTNSGKLYLYSFGKETIEISSDLSKPVHINDSWHAILGPSIFAVNTNKDIEVPEVTAFTLPEISESITVQIPAFTATDNAGIQGYLVTETDEKPSATAAGWSASPPATYTFAASTPGGSHSLYAWVKDTSDNVSAPLPASVRIILNPKALFVNIAGTGDGSVNSSSTNFSCSGRSCTEVLEGETVVTLMATPDRFSVFTGWSGACMGTVACMLTVSADTTVAANFALAPKAKIGTGEYSSLGAAYDDAKTMDTILTLDSDMTDIGLAINRVKIINLEGGYQADYNGRSGLPTLLKGPLNISSGKLTVDRLVIW